MMLQFFAFFDKNSTYLKNILKIPAAFDIIYYCNILYLFSKDILL